MPSLSVAFKKHSNDKFYGFFHRSDKKCFLSLENTLEDLNDKMYKTIPRDINEKHEDLEDIDNLYLKTIENCKEYLIKFCSITITKEAKNRKYIVQLLLNHCTKERLLFKDEALSAINSKNDNLKWRDVLAEARTEKIDITNRDDIGRAGAGTSEILTIGKGDNIKFFKDEEKLGNIKDKINELLDNVKDENAKNLYSKILLSKSFGKGLSYSDFINITTMKTTQERKQFINSMQLLSKNDLAKFSDEQIDEFSNIFSSISKADNLNYFATQLAKIDKNSIISHRNVATSRMGDLLGIGNLVAKSKRAKIKENGKQTRVGNLMDKAKGIPVFELETLKANNPKLKFRITPNAQKELIALQVLDTICGQIDRNLGNYFISITQSGNIVNIDSIQAIDNDLAFGKLKLTASRDNNQLPAFIDKDGNATLSHIDKDIAEKVLGLSPNTLKFIFADLLSSSEIDALIDRLEQVKLAIESNSQKQGFMLDNASWNETTLQDLSKGNNYVATLMGLINDLNK